MTDNGKATELPENERPQEEYDIAGEFAALGKKISEAVNTAWRSEERQKIQRDLRDGLQKFTAEVDKAAKNLRESDVGAKVNAGVKKAREEIEAGKVAEEVRRGLVTALRAFGDALDKMADSFTEKEEAPKK